MLHHGLPRASPFGYARLGSTAEGCAGALSQRTMELPFIPGDTIGIIALILSMPYRLPLQADLQRCAAIRCILNNGTLCLRNLAYLVRPSGSITRVQLGACW